VTVVYELSFKGAAGESLAAAFEGCDVATDRGVPPCWRAVPQPTLNDGWTSGFPNQRKFPGGETWG